MSLIPFSRWGNRPPFSVNIQPPISPLGRTVEVYKRDSEKQRAFLTLTVFLSYMGQAAQLGKAPRNRNVPCFAPLFGVGVTTEVGVGNPPRADISRGTDII